MQKKADLSSLETSAPSVETLLPVESSGISRRLRRDTEDEPDEVPARNADEDGEPTLKGSRAELMQLLASTAANDDEPGELAAPVRDARRERAGPGAAKAGFEDPPTLKVTAPAWPDHEPEPPKPKRASEEEEALSEALRQASLQAQPMPAPAERQPSLPAATSVAPPQLSFERDPFAPSPGKRGRRWPWGVLALGALGALGLALARTQPGELRGEPLVQPSSSAWPAPAPQVPPPSPVAPPPATSAVVEPEPAQQPEGPGQQGASGDEAAPGTDSLSLLPQAELLLRSDRSAAAARSARELLSRVVAEHPENPHAHAALAQACLRLRDTTCALSAVTRAAKLRPRREEYRQLEQAVRASMAPGPATPDVEALAPRESEF